MIGTCFHSLQTGKCIARHSYQWGAFSGDCFHSLQTGKCIASAEELNRQLDELEFPFPSTGKVYCKLVTAVRSSVFNSKFPFPSNGKVYSKTMSKYENSDNFRSFHSLQTGKCIASNLNQTRGCIKMCFNSLQTGKCIARNKEVRNERYRSKGVSIPFKRESVLQGCTTFGIRLQPLVSIPFKRESVLQESKRLAKSKK